MLHRVWEVWRNLKLFTRPLINAKHLQYVAFIFSSFLFTFIWDFWRGLYTCHDICVKVKGQFTGVCSMLHCGSNSSCQPWPLGASTSWATLMTLFSCVCVEWVRMYAYVYTYMFTSNSQRRILGVLPIILHFITLRQGLSLDLELGFQPGSLNNPTVPNAYSPRVTGMHNHAHFT